MLIRSLTELSRRTGLMQVIYQHLKSQTQTVKVLTARTTLPPYSVVVCCIWGLGEVGSTCSCKMPLNSLVSNFKIYRFFTCILYCTLAHT
jgi:hypothetical protein